MNMIKFELNLRNEGGVKQYINTGIAYYDKSEKGKYKKGDEITFQNPDTHKEEKMIITDVFDANNETIGVSFSRK